jgi:hypothetical protein
MANSSKPSEIAEALDTLSNLTLEAIQAGTAVADKKWSRVRPLLAKTIDQTIYQAMSLALAEGKPALEQAKFRVTGEGRKA